AHVFGDFPMVPSRGVTVQLAGGRCRSHLYADWRLSALALAALSRLGSEENGLSTQRPARRAATARSHGRDRFAPRKRRRRRLGPTRALFGERAGSRL